MINIRGGNNHKLGCHLESNIMYGELLGKFVVFWSNIKVEIEALYLHLIMAIYGENYLEVGRVECWVVVLKMVRVI